MTPLQRYQAYLASGHFKSDPAQHQVIMQLQKIYEALTIQSGSTKTSPKDWLNFLAFHKNKWVSGLYIWGAVGRGKTWLLDIFYACLPTADQLRMHFHVFMQCVHQQLQSLSGRANPLKIVAKRLRERSRVICLDEFLVNDVADAMILANLLEALFAEGVTLLTTSNTAPDNLYRDGLQRERFLHAINLLKQHLQVMRLENNTDYRLRLLEKAKTYYYPLNAQTEQQMQASFARFARGHITWAETLTIAGRPVSTIACMHDLVWFDFHVLCNIPRSQLDYIEIAKTFSTVFVSNVPQIQAGENNLARYLINLVDVFYDAGVKLFLSAAVPADELYLNGHLIEEFARTRSRLHEMQSQEYLLKEHWIRNEQQQVVNDEW